MKNTWSVQRTATAIAWIILLVMLGFGFYQWLQQSVQAVVFPFELNYGEGIIWEQARLIFSEKAYAPIEQFPSIVFHYPPVFHAIAAGLSNMFGSDMLATGRTVALLSTVVTAVAAGLIIHSLVTIESGPKGGIIAGFAGALSIFTYAPVMIWSPLMRVDMMAVMFSFIGIALGIRAIKYERLIYWSSLCFVLSVYSKQSSIAAPMALYLILFWLRPSLAIRGISACLMIGSVALAVLYWVTGGGFVRHVFLYNINRVEWEQVSIILRMMGVHAIYFGFALLALVRRIPAIASCYAGLNRADLKTALVGNLHDFSMLILILYWILATLMTLTIAKSGSNINYLIEWMCVTSIFVGLALSDAARMFTAWRADSIRSTILLTCIFPVAFGIQIVLLYKKTPTYEDAWNEAKMADLEMLSHRIRSVKKPIISDNMVILLRNNRPVLWEPAIFAELASAGMWDEEPFINRIRHGEFSMFITGGTRGMRTFDSRYNPRIADAIDEVYPIKETLAGYTLHLPRWQHPYNPLQ